MIRALILDFDGIMVDTESARAEACREVHESYGIPFSMEWFIEGVGVSGDQFDPWERFPSAIDRVGLDREYKAAKELRYETKPAMPGLMKLIDEAHALGLQLGVASNSLRERVEPILKRLAVRSHFDAVGVRGEGLAAKPEPDIYLGVMHSLGVKPIEVIAFEDSVTGVLSAKRAGVTVVAIPNDMTRHHDLRLADVNYPSMEKVLLRELIQMFDNAQRVR